MNNVSPSASVAIAGALFAKSIDDCLNSLNEAERFKASMALNQAYISIKLKRLRQAVQKSMSSR